MSDNSNATNALQMLSPTAGMRGVPGQYLVEGMSDSRAAVDLIVNDESLAIVTADEDGRWDCLVHLETPGDYTFMARVGGDATEPVLTQIAVPMAKMGIERNTERIRNLSYRPTSGSTDEAADEGEAAVVAAATVYAVSEEAANDVTAGEHTAHIRTLSYRPAGGEELIEVEDARSHYNWKWLVLTLLALLLLLLFLLGSCMPKFGEMIGLPGAMEEPTTEPTSEMTAEPTATDSAASEPTQEPDQESTPEAAEVPTKTPADPDTDLANSPPTIDLPTEPVAVGSLAVSGSAPVGVPVELLVNGEPSGDAKADGDGLWTIETEFADAGVYMLSANVYNPSGIVAASSDEHALTVLESLPDRPGGVHTNDADADSGDELNDDEIDDDSAGEDDATGDDDRISATIVTVNVPAGPVPAGTFTLSGDAPAAAAISILLDAEEIATGYADGSGVWSTPVTIDTLGKYTIQATAVDQEGEPLGNSRPAQILIADANAQPDTGDSDTSDDSGSDVPTIAPTTATTSAVAAPLSQPTVTIEPSSLASGLVRFFGRAEPNTRLALYLDNQFLDAVGVDGGGEWQYSARIASGSHDIFVSSSAPGRVGRSSTLLEFVVPADADQGAAGPRGDGGTTVEVGPADNADADSLTPPTFNFQRAADNFEATGTGTPGSSVQLIVDGAVSGTAPVGEDGTWGPIRIALDTGTHELNVYGLREDGSVGYIGTPITLDAR